LVIHIRRFGAGGPAVGANYLLFMRVPVLILWSIPFTGLVAFGADSKEAVKPTLIEIQKKAAKFGTILTADTFESTPQEISKSTDEAIARANKSLDAIGALDPKKVTFKNTIRAMDDLRSDFLQVVDRIGVLREAAPDSKMREAAIEADQKFNDWGVGIDYRKDVYKSIKAYAATNPKLRGEDARLLEYQVRDYKRAGLDLPEDQQKVVEDLRKELARDETLFGVNLNNSSAKVKFTKSELQGVPEAAITRFKTGEDEYTLDGNITFQAELVLDNAVSEEARKKMYVARDNRAREKNLPLLAKVVQLRQEIGPKLGYKTWADYQTEQRMAKTGQNALDFLEKLKDGLEPKYQAEIAELKQIKSVSQGNTTPDVNIWDWRYLAEQLRQQKYQVDAQALKVYFPFDKVLQGMFGVYERIFGIQIVEVQPPSKYVADLKLFAVLDKGSGAPLGLLYMDLFPRPGKFNHFANFSLIEGKRLENGKYQRPTTSLICNFPEPDKDGVSLLSHEQVTIIFHEFGHAMHAILTQAKYVRFSGTSVPQDFVEAPSQMLEYFPRDKGVLDGFAADYRDPSKKIPAEILAQLKASDLATKGLFYRRQLSFGILDLKLHSGVTPEDLADLNGYCNKVMGSVFLPPDPSTAMVASFGHLMGYDAGYYGYAWADSIAADMASVFEAAPDRFLDIKIGRRLRDEIYAQGNSRDITVSIEKFLGRKQSTAPFLKHVGIQ
jgi:thimet oligopeptidase